MNDFAGVFIAAIILLLVVVGNIVLGATIYEGGIVRNCERFGAFYIDDVRYACNKEK